MCDMSHNHNQFHQPDSKEILHSNVMQVLACVTLAKGAAALRLAATLTPAGMAAPLLLGNSCIMMILRSKDFCF